MSVLYKALQKAAKDNEQVQSAQSNFDADRLAGSGVIKSGAGRRLNWRIAGAVIAVMFVAVMGVAVYLTSSGPTSQPQMQTASLAPPAQPNSAQPSPTVEAPVAVASSVPAAPNSNGAAVVAAPTAPGPQAVAAPVPVGAAPAAPEPEVGASNTKSPPASKVAEVVPAEAKPALRAAKPPATHQPMPDIDENSPAQMLKPPISVHRDQFDLAGVGSAVQVRHVSQQAQDTVRTAYAALIRGEYDAALGFYEETLKQEPHSMLALLGRGAALQKLGRKEEAHETYERALKLDPQNREALSNLTAIDGERTPADAIARLVILNREYPSFSPIKAQIGMIYARMDNLDMALDYLRQALALTPDAPMYLYNTALILDRLGRREQAVEIYGQLLSALSGGRGAPELPIADIQRRVTYLRAQ